MIFKYFAENCKGKIFNECFLSIYKDAEKEYEEQGTFFLERTYIESVNRETNAYPRILSLLTEEADRIKEDVTAGKYALFVYKAMCQRKLFLDNLKCFMLPEEYELFGFLCLIPMIKNTYDTLMKMGLDKDIIDATVKQYEECVFIYERRFDKLGMNKRYFDWLQHYVDCEILNINRLRFEIHKLSEPIYMLRKIGSGEDILVIGEGEFNTDGLYSDTPPNQESVFFASFEENEKEYTAFPVSNSGRAMSGALKYPKDRYEKVLSKGDCVLSVHIPVEGELSTEACDSSYKRAKEVFAKFFPTLDVKGFVCYSWMMSPELKLYVKENSRILGFASKYVKFPIHTEGEDVLNFVFYLKFKTYEDLPEDTSLQRNLKALYLNGGKLYEYGGIFAIDKI